MMLSKKCQECTHANTIGDCEGRTNEELQRTPCGKWEFDMNLLAESEEELGERQEQNKPLATNYDDNDKPIINETPADKFRRISANRLKRALYDLKLLAQFGRLYRQYEWTQAQADDIMVALQKGVDVVNYNLTSKALKQ